MRKKQTMLRTGILLLSASFTNLCFPPIAVLAAQSGFGGTDYVMQEGMMGGMGAMMGQPTPSPLEKQIEYLKKARTDKQKETVKQRIRKELNQQYDIYLNASADELASLETRLLKLREKLETRKQVKDKLIDLELQRIVNEAEGLTWPKKMNRRGSTAGLGGMENGNGYGVRRRLRYSTAFQLPTSTTYKNAGRVGLSRFERI